MLADLLEEAEPTVARMDGISLAVERMLTRCDPVQHSINSSPDILSPSGQYQLTPDGLCVDCATVTLPVSVCFWCGQPTHVNPPWRYVPPAAAYRQAVPA